MSKYATTTAPSFCEPLSDGRPAYHATKKQLDYITALLGERVVGEPAASVLAAKLAAAEAGDWENGISRRVASDAIAKLREFPRRVSADPQRLGGMPKVTAGRYALRGGDGVVRFYKVDCPDEGRWAGYTFVAAQASDELHPIKDRTLKGAVLTAIAADPIGALRLYGQEIGACGHCGRTLTDETSREFGIGPVCRRHLGI